MTREEKIARLIRAGYKVERLGRNIKATNKKGSFSRLGAFHTPTNFWLLIWGIKNFSTRW